MRGLRFAQTDLPHVTARITDGENGNRMAAAVCTLFAAGTVTDVAFKQGAAQDLGGIRQQGHESVAFANDLLLVH